MPSSLRSATILMAIVACLPAVSLQGCNTTSSDSAADPANGNALQDETAAESPAAGANDVQLDVLTFDEMQQRLADKQGKVVVMDAWSTSCPPCMKDFHNLVELHQQYDGDDLACVSLSFDYEGLGKPEDVKDTVFGFLKSQQATFDNWMSSEESDVLYRKFELNAVPAIFVYDRSGKLRQRFESEGAYDQVRQLVAELIKESDAAPANAVPSDDSAGTP